MACRGCEYCPLTAGVVKAGEVGVGALRDVEHLGTAEAGHLEDKILFIKSRISQLPEALAFEGGCRRNPRWQNQ